MKGTFLGDKDVVPRAEVNYGASAAALSTLRDCIDRRSTWNASLGHLISHRIRHGARTQDDTILTELGCFLDVKNSGYGSQKFCSELLGVQLTASTLSTTNCALTTGDCLMNRLIHSSCSLIGCRRSIITLTPTLPNLPRIQPRSPQKARAIP